MVVSNVLTRLLFLPFTVLASRYQALELLAAKLRPKVCLSMAVDLKIESQGTAVLVLQNVLLQEHPFRSVSSAGRVEDTCGVVACQNPMHGELPKIGGVDSRKLVEFARDRQGRNVIGSC